MTLADSSPPTASDNHVWNKAGSEVNASTYTRLVFNNRISGNVKTLHVHEPRIWRALPSDGRCDGRFLKSEAPGWTGLPAEDSAHKHLSSSPTPRWGQIRIIVIQEIKSSHQGMFWTASRSRGGGRVLLEVQSLWAVSTEPVRSVVDDDWCTPCTWVCPWETGKALPQSVSNHIGTTGPP